jgi:hypothetical protein
MTPADIALRNVTYRLVAELGRAPTLDEVATAIGEPRADVQASWWRLHDGHALVLDSTGAIRMANPFSAVETPFVVEAAHRRWFANCGWDAFGIGACLHVDSTIQTTCADCGEPLDITVRDGRPTTDEAVWHCLLPARDWWSDIGFT